MTRSFPAGFAAAFAGAALLTAGVALLSPGLRADDFKLKDGSKISGVIVGFDDNSFKVQTSYGFAIVRKDQIASIVISEAPKLAGASAAPSTSTPSPSAAAPAAAPAPAPEPKPEPPPKVVVSPASNAIAKPLPKPTDTPARKIAAPPAPVARASTLPAAAQPSLQRPALPSSPQSAANAPSPVIPPGYQPTPVLVPAASTSANSVAPAPVSANAAAAPPKAAALEPIREEVTGTTYINDTFHFRMYKPPTWLVLNGARAVLPQTIAALGTDNETTYLLIGQESATKSVAAAAAETQHRLVEVMQNFRPTDERQIQLGGASVTERRFRGGIDDQDWSGVVVVVPHGGRLFTIFGMTRADSDLVQIQENVLFRAISSLEFLQ
jgi:hypothetical protein